LLGVSTSASDCLERLVSEVTYNMLIGTLNPTHSLTHFDLLNNSEGNIQLKYGCHLVYCNKSVIIHRVKRYYFVSIFPGNVRWGNKASFDSLMSTQHYSQKIIKI